MLARLQRQKARVTVEFDRSGTLLRVRPARAARRIQAELRASGGKARLLAPAEAATVAARVASWYSQSNVRELTREEFRTLARRWSAENKEATGLTDEQERRLLASLDGAVDAAIDAAGPDGPVDREVWRAAKVRARGRVLEESAGFLSASQLGEVRELLECSLR